MICTQSVSIICLDPNHLRFPHHLRALGNKTRQECHFDIALEWTNDVAAGVYSTPLLADFLGNGRKQIIVASYHQYIEILDGTEGHPLPGWPHAFPKKEFVASPFLVDMNLDGRQELAVASKMGEIFFFNDAGLIRDKTLRLEKLAVRKDWHEGFDTHQNVASFLKDAFGFSNGRKLQQASECTDEDEIPVDQCDEYSWDTHDDDLDWTGEKQGDDTLIHVDLQILATPVVEDLDGDGHQEIIVQVSYYFDRETYKDETKRKKLGADVDVRKCVACAIAIFDLKEHKLKKLILLDTTTDRAEFRAYLVASPTIFDLDGDRSLDIIVGNSVGFLYAMDNQGKIKDNFPITMDEIHTQVLVGDFQNDGNPIIVAADRRGNVVAFNKKGEEVWENRVSGYPPETMQIGDIDADGSLDIVFGTTTGFIWALSAATGAKLPNFPVKTGEIRAPVLLAQLGEYHRELGNPLTIIVPSLDGFVNVVDSGSGCIEKIDLGEQSYAQILVDDVNGNGNLDLIAVTRQGNVHCLSTPSAYHPLKVSPSRMNHQGIYVTEVTRSLAHVTGKSFNIHLEIIDRRKVSQARESKARYTVRVLLGGSLLLHQEDFTFPGLKTITVACPKQRISGVIVVEVTNEVMEKFTDSFSISFNTYFYRIFKWLVALPFMVMGVFVLFVKRGDLPLPL